MRYARRAMGPSMYLGEGFLPQSCCHRALQSRTSLPSSPMSVYSVSRTAITHLLADPNAPVFSQSSPQLVVERHGHQRPWCQSVRYRRCRALALSLLCFTGAPIDDLTLAPALVGLAIRSVVSLVIANAT